MRIKDTERKRDGIPKAKNKDKLIQKLLKQMYGSSLRQDVIQKLLKQMYGSSLRQRYWRRRWKPRPKVKNGGGR